MGMAPKAALSYFFTVYFKKLLFKIPFVPPGDTVWLEAWLHNFFLDALDDVSFFVYCDNISETAV